MAAAVTGTRDKVEEVDDGEPDDEPDAASGADDDGADDEADDGLDVRVPLTTEVDDPLAPAFEMDDPVAALAVAPAFVADVVPLGMARFMGQRTNSFSELESLLD